MTDQHTGRLIQNIRKLYFIKFGIYLLRLQDIDFVDRMVKISYCDFAVKTQGVYMQPAKIPENEAARLEALHRYRILDTPPEPVFDDLAELAAYICETPMATITLIDAGREWYKSRVGVSDEQALRQISFCAHTILGDDLFIVPDTLKDERFIDNPFVLDEPPLRFYAGAPLITPDGFALGTLCVFDHVPRELTEKQINALGIIARQVVIQLEFRRMNLGFGKDKQNTENIFNERIYGIEKLNKRLRDEINARMLVEIELVASEKRLTYALKSAQVGTWDWNVITGRLIWNQEHEKIFGFAPGAFNGTHEQFQQRIHPDDIAGFNDAINRSKKEKNQYLHEYRIVWPDNSIHWVQGAGRFVFDNNNRPVRMYGVVIDITERKETQLELGRTVHALRVLSRCNEVLTRITNEKKLLKEICRIAVKDGGYRFAWVGYPQHDAIKTVQPMAHAGYEAGYLENLITWEEKDKRGQGPIGRVLRTKEKVVVRNFAKDPTLKPWHKAARERGYASGVALPLVSGNEIIGVLVIYAGEADAFGADEVKLLEELADNLALGVHMLHTEKTLGNIRLEVDRQLHELDQLYETAPVGLALFDSELRYVRVNKLLAEAHGLPAKGHIGQKLQKIAPKFARILEPILKQVLRNGKPILDQEIRGTMPGTEGMRYWLCHFYPLPLSNKRIVGVNTIIQDITERKNNENILRLYERIVSGTGDFMSFIDRNYTYQVINDSYVKAFQKKHDEIVGYTMAELFGNEFFNRMQKKRMDHCLAGYQDGYEAWMDMPGYGGRRFISVSYNPYRDNDGSVIGVVVSARDITDRKIAEDALNRSEEKYHAFYDDNPSMYFTVDPNGMILSVNKFGAQQLGYTTKELIGKPLKMIFPANLHEEIRNHIKKCLNHIKELHDWEAQKIHKNGKVIWVKESARAVISPDGNPVVLIVCRDITERKQTEEALKLSENRFRTLTENAPALIYLTDSNGDCTYVNRRWCEAAGMTPEEAYGKGWLNGLHEDDRAVLNEHWDKFVQSGGSWNFEYRFQNKAGLVTWVYGTAAPIYDLNGTIMGYVGTNIDITERKQVEDALREQSLALANAMPGISRLDTSGRYVTVNEAYAATLGYQPGELIGQSWIPTIHPDDLPLAQAACERVVQEGQGEFETRAVRKDGSYFFKQVLMVKIVSAGGEMTGHHCFMRDITERKEAEKVILQSRERLRNLAARLHAVREEERTLISREIHDELGQTLTGLRIDMAWLLNELSPHHQKLADRTRKALMLVDETLDTVRRLSHELRPAMLDDLGLEAAIEWQMEEFQSRTSCQCELNLNAGDIGLNQQRDTAVFRILQEALTNIARHANAAHVTVQLQKQNSELILEINDNGVGVSEEKIFNSQSIGMIGMRERAGALGGHVNISRLASGGTQVTLVVPLGITHVH